MFKPSAAMAACTGILAPSTATAQDPKLASHGAGARRRLSSSAWLNAVPLALALLAAAGVGLAAARRTRSI